MVTLVVFHHVADYDVWKSVFDEHEHVRRDHGQLEHRVYRSVDNPNRVVVHNDFATEGAARSFMADPSLAAAMERAGVTDEPWLGVIERVEQKQYAEGPSGVTLAVHHRVRDYEHWKRASDAATASSNTGSTTRSAIRSSSSSTTTSRRSRQPSPSAPTPACPTRWPTPGSKVSPVST
jgi:quinol monooxygenase YgiN